MLVSDLEPVVLYAIRINEKSYLGGLACQLSILNYAALPFTTSSTSISTSPIANWWSFVG